MPMDTFKRWIKINGYKCKDDVKLKMHRHWLTWGSDIHIQFHDQGEEFNMSKLPKLSHEDEWIQKLDEEIVIQSSSIYISRHKVHREFPWIGKKLSHANKQFQCLIHQRINIMHQHLSQWRSTIYSKLKEEEKYTNVFVIQEEFNLFYHKMKNSIVDKIY